MPDPTDPTTAERNEAATARQIEDIVERMQYFLERIGSWRILPTSAELQDFALLDSDQAETVGRAKAGVAYALASMSSPVCHRAYLRLTEQQPSPDDVAVEDYALASNAGFVASGLIAASMVISQSGWPSAPIIPIVMSTYRMIFGEDDSHRVEFVTAIANGLLEAVAPTAAEPPATSTPESDS